MTEHTEASGTCLCGKTGISAKNIKYSVGACHCRVCRQWGGGPFMTIDCGTDLTFSGVENIATFDSSEWAERGFCKCCGSHLFYRLKDSKQHFVAAGLFDSNEHFDFDHQVFIDKKPPYYCFANQTKDMTEAEVFAHYAPPQA